MKVNKHTDMLQRCEKTKNKEKKNTKNKNKHMKEKEWEFRVKLNSNQVVLNRACSLPGQLI